MLSRFGVLVHKLDAEAGHGHGRGRSAGAARARAGTAANPCARAGAPGRIPARARARRFASVCLPPKPSLPPQVIATLGPKSLQKLTLDPRASCTKTFAPTCICTATAGARGHGQTRAGESCRPLAAGAAGRSQRLLPAVPPAAALALALWPQQWAVAGVRSRLALSVAGLDCFVLERVLLLR